MGSYTWEHGRELAFLTQNGVTWTNTYNADGLRTRRTDGTNTYLYLYYGGLLQYMQYNDTKLYFTQAPDGTPMGILYQNLAYFYITNLQGDVVGIVDSLGNPVVAYTYDAWGDVLSCTGTMADTLGAINPIRYRGYVYDAETGLYYLQSRYYDPEIGRFINADRFTSTGQGLLGNNMFVYCNNSPLNLADYLGYAPVAVTVVMSDGRTGINLEGIVGPYNELRKLTSGNPYYEVHHLVEKRLYRVPGIGIYKSNPNTAPSVILRKEEHKGYTSRARAVFPYGSNYNAVSADSVKSFYLTEYGGKNDWIDVMCSCFE